MVYRTEYTNDGVPYRVYMGSGGPGSFGLPGSGGSGGGIVPEGKNPVALGAGCLNSAYSALVKKIQQPNKSVIELLDILEIRTGANEDRTYIVYAGLKVAKLYHSIDHPLKDDHKKLLEESAANLFPMVLECVNDVQIVMYKVESPDGKKERFAFSVFRKDRLAYQGISDKAHEAILKFTRFLMALDDILTTVKNRRAEALV